MIRSLALALAVLISGHAIAAEKGSQPRLCAEDLPEGARLPSLPSCGTPAKQKPRADGFRNLGDGLSVRMSGRVRAEYGVSR